MKDNKIIDALSYVVVIVAIIFFVIFKNNMRISLLVIGIGGSLYGIISLIKGESYGNYVTSVSLMLALTMGLYISHILSRENATTFMIVGSFGCLMLLSALLTIISRNKCLKVYSKAVIGTVVDLKKNPNTNKEYYNVIYDYEVDNEHYTVANPYALKKKLPSIGEQIMIHVNPSDVTDAWFDIDQMSLMKEIALEVVSAIVAIIILITLFI